MSTEVAPPLAEGRYRLLQELGTGGMATVYFAYDSRLQVTRAIKLLAPKLAADPSVRARFEGEARLMALLEHPHIVRIYDVGVDGPRVFIIMELVQGGSLMDRVEQHGPLPDRMAVEVTRAVLEALAVAHERQVVHRDIKPHNVLVTDKGRVRVTDFGIARLVANNTDAMTRTGTAMGTWAFMPPEQRHNAKQVDARSDIYAVGSTLYTLVTGEVPVDLFAADMDASLLEGIDPAVAELIRRATLYDPDGRYQTVGEMAAACTEAAAQLPQPPADVPPLALPSPSREVPSLSYRDYQTASGRAHVSLDTFVPTLEDDDFQPTFEEDEPSSQSNPSESGRAQRRRRSAPAQSSSRPPALPTTLPEPEPEPEPEPTPAAVPDQALAAAGGRRGLGRVLAVGALVVAVGVGAWWTQQGEPVSPAALAPAPVVDAAPRVAEEPEAEPAAEPEVELVAEPKAEPVEEPPAPVEPAPVPPASAQPAAASLAPRSTVAEPAPPPASDPVPEVPSALPPPPAAAEPELEHAPLIAASKGATVTIKAQVTGSDGYDQVTVRYRAAGESVWLSEPMYGSGGALTATLALDASFADGLEYYVDARSSKPELPRLKSGKASRPHLVRLE